VLAVAALAGCGSDDSSSSTPTIVVTTPMLGSLVSDLVGDQAKVDVLMPNGADPHEYQPSAKDVEALGKADLVVENGLKLEEGLEDALAQARDDGARIFTATDHVTLRPFGADDAEEIAEHGPDDPHIWTSPIAMRQMVSGLAPVLASDLGIDVTARATDLEERLTALDAQITTTLAPIPVDRRKLVTGHESLGYFAQRYNFALIGALIPSLSSQAQVSAANLAQLREQVTAEGVPAIFNEAGTPAGVASAIADQTGVPVIEIATHTLPDDGSYFTFMRDMAAAVSRGLDPPAAG
jgi:zinc/manganese transport system substrate-binding protein